MDQRGPAGPLLISVREAARRIGWGRDLTYRKVREGHIPAVRVGRRFLIPAAALEAFVEEQACADPETDCGDECD